MKKKIAICLSGQNRVFYLFENLYKNLNNIYPDYHFDIFLAGWAHEKESYARYDFLTSIDFFEDDFPDYLYGPEGLPNNFHRLAYLRKQSSVLREKFEEKHQFKYDCVLWTRSDVLIFPYTFKAIFDLLNVPWKAKERLCDVTVYNDTGIQSVRKCEECEDYPYANDRLALGNSKGISVYCNMYDHFFIPMPEKSIPNPHKSTARYTMAAGIGLKRHSGIKYKIVRPTPWHGPVPPAKAREDVVKPMLDDIDLFEVYRSFDNAIIPSRITHPNEI